MEPLLVKLLAVNEPAIELVLQGTAVYLLLFVLFRHVVRREVGSFGVADMLVLVLIAEASQNAMAGEYTTLSEGAILAGTILAWNLLYRLTLVLRHRLIRRHRHARRAGADSRRTHPVVQPAPYGRNPHGTVFAGHE